MKIITKRHGKADPIKDATILQKTMNRLRGYDLVPKGLYRFKTMKAANSWMLKEMVNTHVLRKSRTL